MHSHLPREDVVYLCDVKPVLLFPPQDVYDHLMHATSYPHALQMEISLNTRRNLFLTTCPVWIFRSSIIRTGLRKLP